MDKVTKQEIINKYKQSENDTGSAQIQIALLTQSPVSRSKFLTSIILPIRHY